MQATIIYLLTEQAQRAAMAATGQPVARKQTMTIEITPEDLSLFPVSETGEIRVDLADTYRGWKTLALLAAGWADSNSGKPLANTIDPPILADVRKGLALISERKAERVASDAAKEAAKVAAIDRWVAEHGSESQRARHAAGLLPRQETIDGMVEAAFVAGSELAKFDASNLEPECSDVAGSELAEFDASNLEPECSDEQCSEYECDTDRSVKDYTDGLDAESFARYESIKALFPDATISLRQHAAWHTCRHDEDCHTRYALTCTVAVKYGPFTFGREYAL